MQDVVQHASFGFNAAIFVTQEFDIRLKNLQPRKLAETICPFLR